MARIYLLNGPPDSDGDLIVASIKDGHRVVESLGDHDVVYGRAEPAGEATLHRVGNAVVAFGRTHDSPRGRALRAKLLEAGPDIQWSLAWPTATAKTREPTRAELETWPDARRVIESWDPFEVSPVEQGSCGPMCRTLASKCAGGCKCGGPSVEELFARGRQLLERIERSLPRERIPSDGELSRKVDGCDRAMAAIIAQTTPVSDGKRKLARQWAEAAAAIWKVAPPRVRWGVTSTKSRGEFDPRIPDTIALSPTIGMQDVPLVVVHETGHYARCALGFPWDDEVGVARDTAYIFGRLGAA